MGGKNDTLLVTRTACRMPRSGTSMTAGLVRLACVEMRGNQTASPFQRASDFEEKGFNELHFQILSGPAAGLLPPESPGVGCRPLLTSQKTEALV